MPEKEIQLKSPAVDLDFDKDRLFIGEEDGHCTIIPNLNQIKKNVSKSVKPSSKPVKVEDEMEVDDDEDEPVKNGFVDDEAGEDDVDDLEALWEGPGLRILRFAETRLGDNFKNIENSNKT